MLFLTKVKKFGMILIMSAIMGIMMALTGMGFYALPVVLVSGLIPHDYERTLSGSVRIGDLDVAVAELYDTARLVGSVFQNPRSQFFAWTPRVSWAG